MSYQHKCIKPSCAKEYTDEKDPDPYYCPDCQAEKTALAKRIDRQMASKPPRTMIKSDLQLYEEVQKATGVKFPRG